jgi:hypothetical protein
MYLYNTSGQTKDITDDSGTITEPVTIQQMKDYLRLEGFVDIDDSPQTSLSDFTFDDTLLTQMISAARQLIEQRAGISLIRKTLRTSELSNLCGRQEIPFGPIVSITSVTDYLGNVLTYTTVGESYLKLLSPCQKDLIITYEAGFTTTSVPEKIILDIKRLTAYLYEHRGDDPGVQPFVSQLVGSYSRKTWIS